MRLILLRKSVLILSLVISGALSFHESTAQLTVTNVTPEVAVNDVLLGDGISATNITLSGQASQIGSFNCNSCGINIQSGVVLGSGNVLGAVGPNNSGSYSLGPPSGTDFFGDPDLAAVSSAIINNAAILEFDFIPTGDSLAFDFVFGSDEYPEYVNSINDVFGFFLSGPGINGPYTNNAMNVALIPNTTNPITINSVNAASNSAYYVSNSSPSTHNVQADGFTTVVTAQAAVICGETYHIKIAIGDASDGGWDSWVFLKEGSFESSLNLAFNQSNISPTVNSVYEGCGGGSITLSRPCGLEGDLVVTLSYGGTAQNGTDYNELPTEITIPNGQDSINIAFDALNDLEIESIETLTITAVMGPITSTMTLSIYDTPPLVVNATSPEVNCNQDAVLTLDISGGSGNVTIDWDGLGSANPLIIENPTNQEIGYTVTDQCNTASPTVGSVNVVLTQYAPLNVSLGNDINSNCNTAVEIIPTISGGDGNYTYSWTNNGTVIGNQPTQNVEAQSGIEIVLTVSDGCGNQVSDALSFIVEAQEINFTLGEDPITATCIETLLFEPEITGGTGNYQYVWTLNGTNTGNTTTHTVQVSTNSVVTLTVTDECGGYGFDQVNILIPAVPINLSGLQENISVPCFGLFTLGITATGGVGTLSYHWAANNETLGVNQTLSTSVSSPTVITVTVTDQCGNQSYDAINVSLNPSNMTVELTADDLDVCPDELVTLTAVATEFIDGVTYTWNVSGVSGSEIQVSSPTTVTYTVTATDACAFTATDSYEMVVWIETPLEVPGPNYELCTGSYSGNIINGGVLPYSYAYDPTVIILENELFYSNQVDVETEITVTDHCQNTATFNVNIVSCDVFIPNIFTPNNDEANSRFEIRGIDGFPGSSLFVYNRWGNKIFESANYRNEWSGKDQEEGTYYYVFKRSDGKDYSGYVQLTK